MHARQAGAGALVTFEHGTTLRATVGCVRWYRFEAVALHMREPQAF
jgi:hypothetical protein